MNITESKWIQWQEIKDCLPNLQIMEGCENESKMATPFADWINGHPNVPDVEKFKSDNYIPMNVSLDFKYFDKFYEQRKNLLENALRKILM